MNEHTPSQPPDLLLEAASQAADGRSGGPGAGFDRDQQRILANLTRLASLKSAFARLAADESERPESWAEDTPAQWGHLCITGEIGRGGFGIVYRAFDPVLQREVALKLRRSDRAGTDPASWIEEARRLARVRHPNVVAVHGADVNDGRVGLWSDLLEGVPLDALLASDGPLQRARVLAIARQLASALAAIHEAGLVHGDVKPENVMVEGDRAVLMDFGAGGRQGSRPRYGSPATMAPELLQGGLAGAAGDIYSLGALLYRIALGRSHRGDPQAPTGIEPDPGELRRALGRPLAGLVLRMLEAAPESRPDAIGVSESVRAIQALPRRRARRLATAVVVLALAAGLAASLLALQRVRDERDRSERIKDFMIEGLLQSSPLRASRPASVLEVLEHMEATLDERLAGIDDARAEMRLVLGESFAGLGELSRGLATLERAVQDLQSAPRATERDLGHALISLATMRRRSGDIAGAMEAADQAQEILGRLRATEENRLALIKLSALRGNLHNNQGRPLAALAAHEQTLALRSELLGADDAGLAVDYNNIGAAALRAGLHEQALDAYGDAAALLEAGGRSQGGPMAMVQLGLARASLELSDGPERAKPHLERAAGLCKSNYPPGHPQCWMVAELRARVLLRAGRNAAAITAYSDLLRSVREDPAREALTRLHLAVALLQDGRQGEAAEQFQAAAARAPIPSDPIALVARAGTAYARHLDGDGDATDALRAALAELDDSDYRARSERRLLEAWLASL